MLNINNVLMPDGSRKNFAFNSLANIDLSTSANNSVDGSNLLALPGLVDPHVHFRIPGMAEKEDWLHASKASFKGGFTTVFDMPNTKPATTTQARLIAKFAEIDMQLTQVGIPLKYKLFFGADKNNFHQIPLVKDNIVGIKVFMGSSTGELLMDDESSLHAIYALAKAYNLIIALHAEDEIVIRENTVKYQDAVDFKYHSIIRDKSAAIKAVHLVVELSRIYDVTSYILHLSTKEEIDIITQAKNDGVRVFAETCCHYLFLDDSCYDRLKGKAKMNPPLRSKQDQDYVWQALRDGMIDTIASDHAPHTLVEKDQPLCKCPSGVPGIETTLPLLLTAYKDNKISLERIIELLHTNPIKLFDLPHNDDLVFVDINTYKQLDESQLATKAKWSPFAGMNLTGFPQFVYTNGTLFDVINL